MTTLRSALFNLAFIGGTALAAILALPLLAAPPALLIGFARGWARLVIALLRAICGIRLSVSGLDRIPPGAAIIAAKHQSAFDTVVWLALLPAPVYVLKKELLRIPVWGWLARHGGHVAVDRGAGASALRALRRDAGAALAAGRPVVIFPEGTRTAPGERVRYQPGVAALALATGAPVVPVATDSGRCWGRRAFHKRPGTIQLSVLPPLAPGLSRAALMAALETAIETEAARLLAGPGAARTPGEDAPGQAPEEGARDTART